MTLKGTECRYTRYRIWCDECERPLVTHGSFGDVIRAEKWARECGWHVEPIRSTTDLLDGKGHLCPECAATAAEREWAGRRGRNDG